MNSSGLILIPGIYDDVAPFTDEEKKQYELIEFDVEEHKSNLGVKKFLYDTKVGPFNDKALLQNSPFTGQDYVYHISCCRVCPLFSQRQGKRINAHLFISFIRNCPFGSTG